MIRRLSALALAVVLATGPAMAQAPRPPAPAPTPAPTASARPVAPKPAVPAPSAAKRIDVNSATEAELDTLPGVGPARAKAIVANRPYASVDALTGKALPANVLASDRDRIALANINTSSARDLQQTLPGIGDARAGQIVSGRPYAAPEDLVSKGILTQAAFDRIKDLIAY